ncbi:MAG: glycosyltransferase [Bacteriovoracaceae bacterium]|nr:glycosyltransferase [Bacteriovoracaceae bacterium]
MERVIESLCLGHVEMGHKVTLISYRGDYDLPGINHIYLDRFENMAEAEKKYVELIPGDADVVHLHLPHMAKSCPARNIVTLHGNLREGESLSTLPPQTVFISGDHAKRHGREKFVYHGYDPKSIPLGVDNFSKRKYFAFLGRAGLKRKGLHIAKELAKKTRTKLLIGGGRGISLPSRRYLGHLDNSGKYRLLGGAKALLFPILWDEPFGLVMIEAMFCGASVFALERGSVPEVLGLEGGEDLFLKAADKETLLEKMKKHHTGYTPMDIREYAEKHFSYLKMCEHYLELYDHHAST